MRDTAHVIKVNRQGNELIIHLALLEGAHPRLPGGVLFHSEGWVNITHDLKMFLVIARLNTVIPRDYVALPAEKQSRWRRLLGQKKVPALPP